MQACVNKALMCKLASLLCFLVLAVDPFQVCQQCPKVTPFSQLFQVTPLSHLFHTFFTVTHGHTFFRCANSTPRSHLFRTFFTAVSGHTYFTPFSHLFHSSPRSHLFSGVPTVPQGQDLDERDRPGGGRQLCGGAWGGPVWGQVGLN
jgi:hypothetical protein